MQKIKKIIVEKILYDVLLISTADNKLIITVSRIGLHYVPEYRHSSDFDHRLGLKMRFFGNSCSKSSSQKYNLHLFFLSLHTKRAQIYSYRHNNSVKNTLFDMIPHFSCFVNTNIRLLSNCY